MTTIAPTKRLIDPNEVQRALELFLDPGQIVEIRALKANTDGSAYKATLGGYFDNIPDLLKALPSIRVAQGVYFTLQECDTDLLYVAENKIIRHAETGYSTPDKNIKRYRWLLLDSDIERSVKNISSSDAEHEQALEHSQATRRLLTEQGWPEPITADSGNGAHLLYRIDLPASDSELVKRVLAGIAGIANTDAIKIDTSVFNPARICKLYGSMACKGDNTDKRPHRRARLLEIPATLETVTREQLAAIATPVISESPRSTFTPRPQLGTLEDHDAEYFIQKFGLKIKGEPGPYEGGTRWKLEACVWDPSHTDNSACIYQYPGGRLGASCSHDSCTGKGWKELRLHFEPDAYDRPSLKLVPQRKKAPAKTAISSETEKEVPTSPGNLPPGTPITPEVLCKFTPDDAGNGDAMYALFGKKFAFNGALGWFHYTGTHWEQDESTAALMKAAIQTLRTRRHAAVDLGVENVIKATVSDAKRINGAIACFRPYVVADIDTFDSQEHLLNCRNGVVNLKTMEITPHDASQRFTYCVPINFEKSNFIEWLEYLRGVVGGGQEMIDYLQMALGYSLTGSTREECLFYVYGPTRSGKGTVAEIIMRLLPRPLSTMVDFNSFTAKREGDVSNFDLADLKPSRVVFASESQRNQSLNPAKIKQLTGGDLVRACYKHKNFFAYRPQFKVWMLSNWPVNGDPEDDALWGRVRVIPFPNSYQGKEDKGKKERLKSDEVLTGILYWAVLGAMKWYSLGSTGLKTPEHVVKITQEQRSSLDFVAQWLGECCEVDTENDDVWTSNTEIIKSYTAWCEDNSVPAKKARSLAQSLQVKGLKTGVQKKIDGVNAKGVRGITVRKKDAHLYEKSLFEQNHELKKVTVTDGNGSNGQYSKSEYVRAKTQNHPLPSVTVTNPLPENEKALSDFFPDQQDQQEQARQFLKQFCSQPDYGLRLKEDDTTIVIAVPESVTDAEFEAIQEKVLSQGQALIEVLKRISA